MNDRRFLFPRLGMLFAALLALTSRSVTAAEGSPDQPARPGAPVPAGDTVPRDWLERRITVAEAEAAHPGISDERVSRFPEAARPFGFQNPRWEALLATLAPGDELWTFASPAGTWRHLAGRAGIARVRDGIVLDAIVTFMN